MDGNSLLERLTSRSGDVVLRLGGKLLASSVDPRKEAKQWLENLKPQLAASDRVLVIGVGSGYHLAELNHEFPRTRVLAITLESDLIDAAREIHGLNVANAEFYSCESEAQVLNSSRIRAFLKSTVCIAPHLPSQAADPVGYQEVIARLKMREPLFFSDWVCREQRFTNLFPLQSIPGGDEKKLLSIKDLHRFLGDQPKGQPDDIYLVRALKELVR